MSSVITGNFSYQPTATAAVANVAVELNKVQSSSQAVQPDSKTKTVQEQTMQTVSVDELGNAVEDINQFVNSQGRTLNFSVDEESGKPVVKVIDFQTKEVIRQIPSEEVLTMAKAIKRLQEDLGSATGLIFDKTI